MHLDEEQVQRFLHRELPATAAVAVEEHLAACPACQEMVALARHEIAEVDDLLGKIDHPLPKVTAETIIRQAAGRGPQWGRWAAGVLLVLVLGGVAYAAPGSPVPRWTQALVSWAGGREDALPLAPTPQTPRAEMAGVAVTPGARLIIMFASTQPLGQAQVSLTEGGEVVVRTISGGATFTSDVDRLLIQNPGSTADFEIEIPRTAPRVEIRVGGSRIFLKDGARVTTETPSDSAGIFSLPLTLPGG